MRFRKSITICKGVKLNFSKSGVSATVGGKGISANVGKQGVYLNTSLPGTGIYDRKRIVNFGNMDLSGLTIGGLNVGEMIGGKKASGGSGKTKPGASSAAQVEVPEQFQLEMTDDGTIRVYDKDGMLIGDPAVLNKLKSTASYRQSCEQLIQAQMAEFNAQTEAFVNIGQLSADVPRAGEYERILRDSRPEKAQAEPFPDPEPTREGIRKWLEAEAKEKVTALLSFNIEKKREDWVNANLAEAYAQEHEAWEQRKAAFDAEQQKAVDEANAQLEQEHEERMDRIRRALEGGAEEVEELIADWLGELELPIDFDVEFEFDADKGVLMVDMDLPEIEHLPTEKMVELSTGKLKTKDKSQKELRQEYSRCVFGLGMFIASHFFSLSPLVKKILLSGYTQRRDSKTGDTKDDYIYSVVFERSGFERAGYQKKDPELFICKFKNRMNELSTGELKAITPFGPEDLEGGE